MTEAQNPHYVTPEEAGKLYCATQPQWGCCSGPKCMGWRWREDGLNYNGLTADMPTSVYSTTHGYCGMVRS